MTFSELEEMCRRTLRLEAPSPGWRLHAQWMEEMRTEYQAYHQGMGLLSPQAEGQWFQMEAERQLRMRDDWLDEVAVPALNRAWSEIESAPPLTLEAWREAYERWVLESGFCSPPEPHVFFGHSFVELLGELGSDPIRSAVEPWRWPDEQADNATQELLDLVAAGDEAGFRELAGCVMTAEDVEPCWRGARARLGLQA